MGRPRIKTTVTLRDMRETLANISNALQQGNMARAEIYAQELVCHLKAKGLLADISASTTAAKSVLSTVYNERGIHA